MVIPEGPRSADAGAPSDGKAVLITGAGGSIGSALAKAVLAQRPRKVVLVDHSEASLYEIDAELSREAGPHVSILGDVGDKELLAEVFEEHRPETIFHAAAFKQVPMMEQNPIAAVKNNALATQTLIGVARSFGTSRVVLVSTDKAVRPASVMGASKRVAERIVLARCSDGRALRLGNVLESRGSVAPLFRRQAEAGGPLTVSHPDVRRYFLTLDEAVDLLLRTERMPFPGVFVPVLRPQVRILELARDLVRASGNRDVDIVFTGLRPGDKMSEDVLRDGEVATATADPGLLHVEDSASSEEGFSEQLAVLEECAARRDEAGLIRALGALVPDYRPSVGLPARGPLLDVGREQ